MGRSQDRCFDRLEGSQVLLIIVIRLSPAQAHEKILPHKSSISKFEATGNHSHDRHATLKASKFFVPFQKILTHFLKKRFTRTPCEQELFRVLSCFPRFLAVL